MVRSREWPSVGSGRMKVLGRSGAAAGPPPTPPTRRRRSGGAGGLSGCAEAVRSADEVARVLRAAYGGEWRWDGCGGVYTDARHARRRDAGVGADREASGGLRVLTSCPKFDCNSL